MTVDIKYEGPDGSQDSVVGYVWSDGDVNSVSEEDAERLLTNGRFSRVTVDVTCAGTTADGSSCQRSVDEEGAYCSMHEPSEEDSETENDPYDDAGLDFSDDDY